MKFFEEFLPMIENFEAKKNYNRGSKLIKIKCHLSLKRMTKFHACRVVARENENISIGCLTYTHHLSFYCSLISVTATNTLYYFQATTLNVAAI